MIEITNNLSDLIRIRDERIRGFGESKYFHFNYLSGGGVVINYTNYEERIENIDLKELFRGDEDIQTCNIGMESKLIYYTNRLDNMDFKVNDEDFIKYKILKLKEYLSFFNTTYDGVIRKLKIKIILE